MQPATESLAAIVSSNGRKDAATRPVPFPETQRVSSPVPKQEGWPASARNPSVSRKIAQGIADPDPPDKRRRPPRANRRALVFVGTWAAANPNYANAELRSSAPLSGRRT